MNSNLVNEAAFSNKSFTGERSLAVKTSHLLTRPHDKGEILAVCLPKLP